MKGTKEEIIDDLQKLITKIEKFNKTCKPHSEDDYWSGLIYHNLCSIKIKHDEQG